MIVLYAWPTPNAQKVSILLEELDVDYEVVAVDINKGEQFAPGFLAISPNNRMPAIVDRAPAGGGEPVSVFESGAILIYLAEKYGRFLPGPDDVRGRKSVLEWLMWQMGGLGPMAGQAHHFRQAMGGVEVPYGIERYSNEVRRLYGVMDRRLADNAYLAGAAYSIADMACWPWTRPSRRQGIDKAEFPNVRRWFDAISARPAVQAGMGLLAEHRGTREMTPESRDVLFGHRPSEPR
jgi:GST-like protein